MCETQEPKAEQPAPPDALEYLSRWLLVQLVEAQHGTRLEDAGRVSAYARTIEQIRKLQGR